MGSLSRIGTSYSCMFLFCLIVTKNRVIDISAFPSESGRIEYITLFVGVHGVGFVFVFAFVFVFVFVCTTSMLCRRGPVAR